jgi:hypothetical protein
MAEQQITLNYENSISLLIQYTELCQKSGVFTLQEADLLKKVVDSLKSNTFQVVSHADAQNLLIQAVIKGQTKGAFTLADASIVYNVCSFLSKDAKPEPPKEPLPRIEEENEELFDLSAPVPLKTTHV